MGVVYFNQLVRSRNQLVIPAEYFGREENLYLVLIPTMSNDKDEQIKLTHKVVDVMDQANRKTCLTLLHYKKYKLEKSFAQLRAFAKTVKTRNRTDYYVKNEFEEIVYIFDVLSFVSDKVIEHQPFCNVL